MTRGALDCWTGDVLADVEQAAKGRNKEGFARSAIGRKKLACDGKRLQASKPMGELDWFTHNRLCRRKQENRLYREKRVTVT